MAQKYGEPYPTPEEIRNRQVQPHQWSKLTDELYYLTKELAHLITQGQLFLALRNPWRANTLEVQSYLREAEETVLDARSFTIYLNGIWLCLLDEAKTNPNEFVLKSQSGNLHYKGFENINEWFVGLWKKLKAVREKVENVVLPDPVEVGFEDRFDPEGMFRAGGDYSYTGYPPRKLDNPDETKETQ